MRNHNITIPELSMIAGTRAMAGAGIGLLLADRLSPEQRRAVGWTLALVGGVLTIPLALEVILGQPETTRPLPRRTAADRYESAPQM